MYSTISRFLFFLVIIYIFVGFFKDKGPKNNFYLKKLKDLPNVIQNFEKKRFDTLLVETLQDFKIQYPLDLIQQVQKLPLMQNELELSFKNKEIASLTMNFKDGNGKPAVCDDRLNLDYRLLNNNRELIKEVKSYNFIINSQSDQKFKLVTEKRKVGQEFETSIYDPNTPSKPLEVYQVKINEIKFTSNLHKFNDIIIRNSRLNLGIGKRINCNDKVRLKINFKNNHPDFQNSYEFSLIVNHKDFPRELLELILGERFGTIFLFEAKPEFIEWIPFHTQKHVNKSFINTISFTLELLAEK